VRGFGPKRNRAAGARPMKGARVPVPERSPDAALGRAMRGLVGPASEGRRSKAAPSVEWSLPSSQTARSRRRGGLRLVTPARAGGLLGILASGLLLTFVTGPTAFALSRTELPELTWTETSDVEARLALPAGVNVFQLDTAPLEDALRTLPAVADAQVSVRLPDAALVVHIDERTPVLAWQVDQRLFIADGTGVIFAIIDVDAALPAGVAVVDDRRRDAGLGLAIGAHLDAIDLDVATRLGSLTPADVGSGASGFSVIVTNENGFVVAANDAWQAVFGFYSPATRGTDMIPAQVRLLRSLLAGREASVRRVILASGTDGTYVPRSTPGGNPR